MTPADLVAVASIGSSLQILTRLHGDKERVHAALQAFSAADGTAFAAVDASTAATDEAAGQPDERYDAADVERAGARHVQQRRPAARAEDAGRGAAPIQQKKAILYFSSGMQRNGTDNQVELRAAVNAARARERRDLPGGLARPAGRRARRQRAPGQPRRRGRVLRPRRRRTSSRTLAAQQETLKTLAADTGGTAFHRFERFRRSVRQGDEGHFVVLHPRLREHQRRQGRTLSAHHRARCAASRMLKIDAREGYYADRDFAHTAKGDREAPAAGAADDADPGDRRADVRHGGLVPARVRSVLRACLGGRPGRGGSSAQAVRRRSRSTSRASSATSATFPSAASATR